MKKSVKIVLAIFITLLVIFLIWGLIGASRAEELAYECDFGFEKGLCWKWHQREITEIINDETRDRINNLFAS